MIGGIVVLVALVLAGLLLLGTRASIESDPEALAHVSLPFVGGTIGRVSVVTGAHSAPVPVSLRSQQIWPRRLLSAHQTVTVEVTVRRPGWIAWLAGSTERVRLTLTTPSASLAAHYLTLHGGAPLTLHFKEPIEAIAYGPADHLVRHDLSRPMSQIRLPRTAEAGTVSVAAIPRRWETAAPTVVSWFPAGSAGVAVASPAPGSKITPNTTITLTFSGPVAQTLHTLPPLSPAAEGSWRPAGSHAIAFVPHGYGYGLGTKVSLALPAGLRLVGGSSTSSSSTATWQVPSGSPLRLQQLLATLGYLPLRFNAHAPVGSTPAAQVAAAVHPPAGNFTWRYGNVPAALRSAWAPGTSGAITQGALMAFQDRHGLTADGSPGAATWKALIKAAAEGRGTSSGYTYVMVDKEASPESLTLWHSGKTIFTTLVNTGIDSAPTASGTYPVFEHVPVTTMSGTNPDGSHYSDPGIQYVSYFNGGDALHAFTRGQYGSPQSLGCVEMDLSSAAKVYPYTPIGTLVHVA